VNTRKEKDFLGEKKIPHDALYGIHSLRAQENFPSNELFSFEWYKSIALTKLAIYRSVQVFINELKAQYPHQKMPFKMPDEKGLEALILAATEVSKGEHFKEFIVPAISGGAGTSFNMNINEIICNRALQLLNANPGEYEILDPIEDANIFQSTNDIIPTSLHVTLMELLTTLENDVNDTRKTLETLEKNYRHTLRVAYTQMQQAVPSSYGKLFGAYQEALSRDWWRISKTQERLKVINLGGSAIGTGLSVPQFIIFKATEELRNLSSLPLARAEQLCDATMNHDSLVETHAILKAHAVNLEKMANDLRLLGSDLFKDRSLFIPARQKGSSIMPGKVNPVICEYVISIAHSIYANDQLISSLASQGCLELNPYLPTIGHAFIDSLKKLKAANLSFNEFLLKGIEIDEELSKKNLFSSPAITTALVPQLGYHKAEELSKIMKEKNIDIFKANEILNFIPQKDLDHLLSPSQLLRLGFKISDCNLEG